MSDSGTFLLPPDVRALIDADRTAAEPPPVIKDGLARRLEKTLGLGALALGASLASSSTAAATSAATMVASTATSTVGPPAVHVMSAVVKKWVAGASLSFAVGGGLVSLARHHAPAAEPLSQSSVAIAPLQRPAMLATTGESVGGGSPDPLPSASQAGRASVTSVPGGSPSVTEPQRAAGARVAANATDRLAEERALLDGARRALVHRDPSGALQTIRLHERLFQQGQLVQERESMRVQALVLAHDFGAARSAGDRFRRRFPHSVLLAVVDKSLEGVP